MTLDKLKELIEQQPDGENKWLLRTLAKIAAITDALVTRTITLESKFVDLKLYTKTKVEELESENKKLRLRVEELETPWRA